MTECNACGRCCDPVILTQKNKSLLYGSIENLSDDNKYSAIFAQENWKIIKEYTINEEVVYELHCSYYDNNTKLCTAYNKRPPICQGYPWYDHEPNINSTLPPGCSFWEDLGGERKMLPIVEIK